MLTLERRGSLSVDDIRAGPLRHPGNFAGDRVVPS
jgi:hypothetical protein